MTCKEAKSAWHAARDDGRLTPGVHEHLAKCDACRAYHANMDRLEQALTNLRAESESNLVAPRSPRRIGYPARWAAQALGWAAFVALLIGPPGRQFTAHRDDGAVRSPIRVHVEGSGPARVVEDGLRLAPEVEPLGRTAEQFLVLGGEIPRHPEVKLYWLYPTGSAGKKGNHPFDRDSGG